MNSQSVEIEHLIRQSLLISPEQKDKYLALILRLTANQQNQLKEILKLEKVMLTAMLKEELGDPEKQKMYQDFQKSFSYGVRQAFKDKEVGEKKDVDDVLLSLEKEFESL
ncbi:hypothetical protein HN954_00205 [bacterium]|jgi:hypothetical protein|nr:hypothetical protein [bacterium]MBT6832058.1 hypothetical protein [bacterium]MBT6995839.1 hypothetical protein [bacterium]MBT7772350.1 hypothetical protein [bacterium]